MPSNAALTSLAVAFPSIVRTNAHWREGMPALVAEAEQHALARLWAKQPGDAPPTVFEQEMVPYLDDPFRGAIERRVRAPDETALSIELQAARRVLAAADLEASDIDLALVSSFMPDRFGVGNAAPLARELGLTSPAWNYESACSGSLVGLHMAAALTHIYRRILVVVSTSNSAQTDDRDTLSWFVGDGAAAFVVERSEQPGVLGTKVINTLATIDMFRIVSESTPSGPGLTTLPHPEAGRMARDTAEPYLHECVHGVLEQTGLRLDDIDFFAFNTPTAWYASFCARSLGVDPSKTFSVYPRYANIGAALMPATVFHAAHEGRLRPGDKVLAYSVGSTSTAAAAVFEWGNVGLGPLPATGHRSSLPPHNHERRA